MSRDPKWVGIQAHGSGWRAAVSHGRHRPKRYRYFPKDTAPAVMQAWRADAKAEARLTRKQRASRGTFEGDAARYLAAVKALPTYQERVRHIALWTAQFGTRRRETITPADIRAIRDTWLTEPRGAKNGQSLPPLGPATCNRRLRALSNLWTVLDGPRADNPVRLVKEAPEPDAVPRDLDYPTIQRILDALPDRGTTTKGEKRPTVSLTKIRLRILAFTGIPASQLKRVKPEDVDLERGWVSLPGRRKGHGSSAAILPLLPPAVAAFADLAAANGFGPFSTSAMHSSFARAAKTAKVSGVSPYTLRHSFATVAYDVTEDEHLVMALLQHASLKTSARYRLRAMARVLERKAARLGQHFTT